MTVYSAVQFLTLLLIAASVIAVVAARMRVPYKVALVVGGPRTRFVPSAVC